MKIGIFSPYLNHLGGGERYVLTAVEYFLEKGNTVDFFWDGEIDLGKIEERFSLNLKGLAFKRNIFSENVGMLDRLRASAAYDLIFLATDGSIPLTFAHKNLLHLQQPFKVDPHYSFVDQLKLLKINRVLYNSEFTKKHNEPFIKANGIVLYPPVDIARFAHGPKGQKILSVGRFFSPSHPKNHEVMVKSFINLVNKGLRGWTLELMGGLEEGQEEELAKLLKMAKDYPVKIRANVTSSLLAETLSSATIYWHAAGFGHDVEKNPSYAEHFGISTVESMAAGCVPIVYGAGGQLEIVEAGVSGFFWQTPEELEKITLELINDNKLTTKLSLGAISRSKKFSKERFKAELSQIENC